MIRVEQMIIKITLLVREFNNFLLLCNRIAFATLRHLCQFHSVHPLLTNQCITSDWGPGCPDNKLILVFAKQF